MENKEIERKRFIVSLIVYIFCLVIMIGFVSYHYTIARYSKGVNAEYTSELKDFDLSFQLRYNDGIEHTVSPADLQSSHGVVRLTSSQYESLKLDTMYTGEGKCYYRFKITESWLHKDASDKDVLTPRSLSDYNLSDDFYDNRSYDGYIYCKSVISGNSPSDTIVTNAITNCTPGSDAVDLLDPADAATLVDISVEVEGVQWNRAKEIWGLSKLPWE